MGAWLLVSLEKTTFSCVSCLRDYAVIPRISYFTLKLQKSFPGTCGTKLDSPRLIFWALILQEARGHLGTSATDMPHCLSHWSPWVPMPACSLSSPVEQNFSHFSSNPYKMPPRERHLSSRLKTMRWAPGRVRNTTYLRGQRMAHISTLCNIVLMDFSSFPVTSKVASGSGSSEALCPWPQFTCSWHDVHLQ